jgi:hypothetical protein
MAQRIRVLGVRDEQRLCRRLNPSRRRVRSEVQLLDEADRLPRAFGVRSEDSLPMEDTITRHIDKDPVGNIVRHQPRAAPDRDSLAERVIGEQLPGRVRQHVQPHGRRRDRSVGV